MASFACRVRGTSKSAVLLVAFAACSACALPRGQQPTAAGGPAPSVFDAGVILPEGAGREIVVSECLVCHELAALELFRGFYTQDSWRSLVLSMRAHGAEVDDAEVEVVSAYLARHFGTGAP